MSDTLKVYVCVSRNKDNKHLTNFKQRTASFLAKVGRDSIQRRFKEFVADGQDGELSRLYESVNARDKNKVRKNLIKRLVEDEDLDMTKTNSLLASIAAEKCCAGERKWLLDVDTPNEDELQLVIDFLTNINSKFEVHKTINGYAVVIDHGFDTRDFNFDFVEIKKDDLLLIKWEKK